MLFGATFGVDNSTFRLPDLSQKVPAKGLTWCVVVGGTWPAEP